MTNGISSSTMRAGFCSATATDLPARFADTIAAPDGTAISYTDSLPWVSIFFKLLRGMLPATFQWFGLYTLLCFALQGAAGRCCARAARAAVRRWPWGRFLSGALFACLPTLWGARVPPCGAGLAMAVSVCTVCVFGTARRAAQRRPGRGLALVVRGPRLCVGGHPPVFSAAGHGLRAAGRCRARPRRPCLGPCGA